MAALGSESAPHNPPAKHGDTAPWLRAATNAALVEPPPATQRRGYNVKA